MLIEINPHRTLIYSFKYGRNLAIADHIGGYSREIKREAISGFSHLDDIFTVELRGNKKRYFCVKGASQLVHFLELWLKSGEHVTTN